MGGIPDESLPVKGDCSSVDGGISADSNFYPAPGVVGSTRSEIRVKDAIGSVVDGGGIGWRNKL